MPLHDAQIELEFELLNTESVNRRRRPENATTGWRLHLPKRRAT